MQLSGTLSIPTARSFRRPATWALLLGCIPVLAGIYALLPVAGPARAIAYPLYGIGVAVVIGVAALRTQQTRRRSWMLLALAFGLLAIGDVTYSVLELVEGEVPYPSLADVSYIAGYVALGSGLMGLIRGRARGRERTALIDAAILTAGAGAAFWLTIMLPSISGVTDPMAIAVSLAYPAADLVLLMIGTHALLGGGARPRFLQLIMAGLALYFLADVAYGVAVLGDSYAFGDPIDLAWIVGVLLIGAASLHPSTREPVPVPLKAETALSRQRLGLLAVAAFLAPALLVLRGATTDLVGSAGLVVAWTILFGLVLVRMASSVDELGTSLRQRRRLEDDLTHQATHDSLTNLANRALFETRLQAAVVPNPLQTGLIFIDLDDFKTVNDTLGHATGDALLKAIAERIQGQLRSADLVARLGGDEFAVLVERCPDEAALRSLADRILAAIRVPVALAGRHLVVHASAGMAFGREGLAGLDLMRDADVAMYHAKSQGKGQVERHEPAMHEAIVRGYELRTELAEAVVANSFLLEYQPIVDIKTGTIVAGEALVRWRHPTRGILGPNEFIGLAEASGLIHELGSWILREACRTATQWPPFPDGRGRSVGVNMSPAQLLAPRFLGDLISILEETGLEPRRLTLEITESALIDLEAAAAALTAISQVGVKLALDDFGTGYSALSYIANLPFDIVKIDRAFVSGVNESERVESLLSGMLGLCRSLGLLAVAEGVETEAQLARLRRRGCPEGQGFLFARPMSPAGFQTRLLDDRPAGPSSNSKFWGSVSLAPEA